MQSFFFKLLFLIFSSRELYIALKRTKNYGSIVDIKGKDLPKIDTMTYSVPCTDISTAGKGAGLEVGTRSGLLWEVKRILSELNLENIEFLEDSVENNHYLSDYLEKCKFDVIENRVIIKESKIFLLWRLNIYFKREIYRRNSINLQKILIFIYFIKNNILIFFSVMFYT